MPPGQELYQTTEQKTALEERNSRLQIEETKRLILEMNGVLAITPATVLGLQKQAIQGIYSCAGQYPTWPIFIRGSKHRPPPHNAVAGLVEQMCEAANENLGWGPITTAAYLLWRLNWIHPFGGGNGRTSRAVSYLALNVRLGYELPGDLTIPQQLITDRRGYQEALEDADTAWEMGILDVSRMEALLSRYLENQLGFLDDVS